jgi:glutathione synthase
MPLRLLSEQRHMNLQLGIVMDPIESIKVYKDSSFAMMLAAQKKGWPVHYMQPHDLYLNNSRVYGRRQLIKVTDDKHHWFDLGEPEEIELGKLDVILMRKDPPFDMEYIYTTYLLELAEQQGARVINKPSSLRDANEKLFITRFPQCCTEMLVSRDSKRLRSFIQKHQDVILKPLNGMGGASIFRVRPDDVNLSVILETITQHNSSTIMAQKFIPEITRGDKRILMINGEAVPYALARLPAHGETRGNLAAGGTGIGMPLTEREQWICQQVGPTLKAMGLMFVGLDVIGDYLTEINVTSPTCIRELDQQFSIDIGMQLMDCIASLQQ